MLPALVGSPPRRESRPAANNIALHGHSSSRGGSSPSPRCFSAWHVPTASNSDSVTPVSLQLSSPWAQSYASGTSSFTAPSAVANSSPSPGRHPEAGGGLVPPTLSPPGTSSPALLGGGGAAAAIADFSPTWDFAPGGAKLLICLASPLDAEVGSSGPIVFFADRPVQVRLSVERMTPVYESSVLLLVCIALRFMSSIFNFLFSARFIMDSPSWSPRRW